MPAMHRDVYSFMEGSLDVLLDRMKCLIPFEMTHRECIELVAPAEHIEILTNAAKYADIQASEDYMRLHIPATVDGETHLEVHLQMRTHGQKEPPLRPRTPQWTPGLAAGDKVIAYTEQRLVLGRRFGLAYYVLNELDRLCDSGSQMRYLWPVCMHLVKGALDDSRTGKWAEKFAHFKACRSTPAISPQLKQAIQDTSALLTSAVLMGEDVHMPAAGEVDIHLEDMPSFNYDGTMRRRL